MRKVCELGRSMVEMLGVLAIIGVLSVGGIAGYSKAMEKYKLNNFSVSINQFINNILELKPQLDRAYNGQTFKAEILDKLGLIPDGLKFNPINNSIKDIFNSTITFHYGQVRMSDGSYNLESYIYYELPRSNNKITNYGSAICHNMLYMLKQNATNISHVALYSDKTTQIIRGYTCKTNNKCLKNLTMTDIENFCYDKSAEEGKLGFAIYLFN